MIARLILLTAVLVSLGAGAMFFAVAGPYLVLSEGGPWWAMALKVAVIEGVVFLVGRLLVLQGWPAWLRLWRLR